MRKFAAMIVTVFAIVTSMGTFATTASANEMKSAEYATEIGTYNASSVNTQTISAPVAYGYNENKKTAAKAAAEKEQTGAAAKAEDLTGTYTCGRALIDIEKNGDLYDVTVDWGCSADEIVEWTYTCRYDEENDCLVADNSGTKTVIDFDEDGNPVLKNSEYTEGSAQFLRVGSSMIWDDKVENAGAKMIFEQMI